MLKVLTFLAASLLMLPGVIQAGFQIGFTGPGAAGYLQSQAGTNVNETLFIQATGADTLQSLFGFRFNLTAGAGGTTVVGFAATPGVWLGNNTAIAGGFDLNYVTAGADVPAVANRVNLGTVTFNLGPALSMTPINFTDVNAATNIAGSFNNGGLAAMDNLVLPGSQIVSVPEPSSLLLGLALSPLVMVRRKRS